MGKILGGVTKFLGFILVVALVIFFWPASKETDVHGLEAQVGSVANVDSVIGTVNVGDLVFLKVAEEHKQQMSPEELAAGGPLMVVLEITNVGYVVSDAEGDTFMCSKLLNTAGCNFMETRDIYEPTYSEMFDTLIRESVR